MQKSFFSEMYKTKLKINGSQYAIFITFCLAFLTNVKIRLYKKFFVRDEF